MVGCQQEARHCCGLDGPADMSHDVVLLIGGIVGDGLIEIVPQRHFRKVLQGDPPFLLDTLLESRYTQPIMQISLDRNSPGSSCCRTFGHAVSSPHHKQPWRVSTHFLNC